MISDHRCTILFWSWTNWLRWDQRRTKVLVATEGGSDEKHQAQRSPNAKLDQHLIQFPTIKRMLGAVFFSRKNALATRIWACPTKRKQTSNYRRVIYYCLFVCFPACLLYLSISAGISTVYGFLGWPLFWEPSSSNDKYPRSKQAPI